MNNTRPCLCDNCEIGKPWNNRQCRLCWLYYNHPGYHKKFGGPGIGNDVVITKGPGTHLKERLEWFGLQAGECSCEDRAKQMNLWGVDGCRKNRETIIDWLEEASHNKGIPTPRWVLGILVDAAISKSKPKERV